MVDVLGPLNLQFNTAVGHYVQQSSVSDKTCLREFFEELQHRGLSPAYRHMRLGHAVLVIACNHVIEIILRPSRIGLVESIKPGYTGPHSPKDA